MPDNDAHLVPLISTPGEPQAAIIVNVLKEQGVKAVAEGGLTSGFRAETYGEVRVMVFENELDRARRLLKQYRDEVKDIDWDQVDLGEIET